MFSSIQEQNIHYLPQNVAYIRKPTTIRTGFGIVILILIASTFVGLM